MLNLFSETGKQILTDIEHSTSSTKCVFCLVFFWGGEGRGVRQSLYFAEDIFRFASATAASF